MGAFVQSGAFDYSIAGAITDAQGWGANEYWAAFNNLATSAVGVVPEPAAWSMMLLGVAAIGAGLRAARRAKAMLATA